MVRWKRGWLKRQSGDKTIMAARIRRKHTEEEEAVRSFVFHSLPL